MIDFLFAAAIAVPVVLGAAWWLFSRLHRADERRVMAFASRLNCPTCGVSDFVWTAQWAVNEPDMEGEVGGDTRLCDQCGKEFHFTDDGKEFRHPSLDDSPEGRRSLAPVAGVRLARPPTRRPLGVTPGRLGTLLKGCCR